MSRPIKLGTRNCRQSSGQMRLIRLIAISTSQWMACHSIGIWRPFQGLTFRLCLRSMAAKNEHCLWSFQVRAFDFANVKQLMLLPAGDYSFSGRVRTEELRTSRGLWWRIFCANNPAKSLANTELVSGTMPWTDFTVKFQVPAADCRAQWLQLELPARIDPELQIEGQVWYQRSANRSDAPQPPLLHH